MRLSEIALYEEQSKFRDWLQATTDYENDGHKFADLVDLQPFNLADTLDGDLSISSHWRSGLNNLKSLAGAPRRVKGILNLSDLKGLTSLRNGPKKVDVHVHLTGLPIDSLDWAPSEIGGWLRIVNCKNLTTFKCNTEIEISGCLYIAGCSSLKSFEGIDEVIMFGSERRFNSVIFSDIDNPKCDLLSLLKVKGLTGVEFANEKMLPAKDIINTYLESDKTVADLLDCQNALIDADYL